MDTLHIIAVISLLVAAACALIIVVDLITHPQHMWIMNVVWPLTALYAGPLALWAYYRAGRLSSRQSVEQAKKRDEKMPGKKKPFWQTVGLGATHCGSGCTLGDICAEWLIVLFPFTLFGKTIFGAWVIDYAFAFLFGIAFQFFTIKPMRNVSSGQALKAAVKADTLSLTSWQCGMYGWMAIAVFLIFGHELAKTDPVFWFMMQIAMIAGFMTSYPVNWWLLRKKIKEPM
ncbi:MAG TPA: DUF4396 domain-containing protein [Terriglobales bacterium]|nr:DUF4396 domain-containing protein [Terriglobales bacterium]